MTRNDLSGRKLRFVLALLAGKSVSQAAEEVGVRPRQGWRYLADHAVKEELKTRQDELLACATRRATEMMTQALDTLREIMADSAAPTSSRVAAARAILERGERLYELCELAGRVTALELRLGGGDGNCKSSF